ncbi:TMEM175 family protein [Flavobacterium acetivorans]|uniref:TMEM175 family protein n=1 Tax=Flavobacterium acetivorans TaxID=2893883 RepID=UPI001E4FA0BF|nr:TMEM175 family protein [Flavobacterium sp. F-29]UFH34766.1 TMEM175 family protein [Flavobacterium sp. F-29]
MNKNRLEAFSDGVLAIIITIMILEIKVPQGEDFRDLFPLFPKFISYVLSFVYVGIYWNNHHHLLQGLTKVNGKILWANLHLLFWLSLIPVSTGWLGEHYFSKAPVTLYGIILFMSAIAFLILKNVILSIEDKKSLLAEALRKNSKERFSQFLYLAAIVVSFFNEWISISIYFVVAIIWLIPDTRIEKVFLSKEEK